MPLDLAAIADVVAMAITDAVAPFKAQLAVAEAKLLDLSGLQTELVSLRDRVLVAETKAALLEQRPVPVLEAKSLELPPEILRRVEMLEQRPLPSEMLPPVDLTPLQERLGKLETKAATPSVDVSEFAVLRSAVLQLNELPKELGALRERVAVVEVRQPMPGPAGKDGAAGRDGADGLGFDDLQMVQDGRRVTVTAVKGDRVKSVGTATFPSVEYRDVWEAGKSYERGDLTTWGGSMWHANEPTTSKPGESKEWTLMVKRGRDGRDGKDAVTTPVVTVGRS